MVCTISQKERTKNIGFHSYVRYEAKSNKRANKLRDTDRGTVGIGGGGENEEGAGSNIGYRGRLDFEW